MIKSTPLTPFRWYDDFYEQDRFSRECAEICPFKLISPNTKLLPFLFKRPASGDLVDTWILRKACDKPLVELIPSNESAFVNSNSSYWNRADWTVEDGHAVPDYDLPGSIGKNGILTIGKTYTIHFDITKYCGTEIGFSLTAGGVDFGDFYDVGHYEFTFTAVNANFKFETLGSAEPEIIWLDNVQVYEEFEVSDDDVELDATYLKLFNAGDEDYIMYVGTPLSCLPCGDYYSIIKTGDSFFYSEVITLINFIEDKSPYVKLTWRNECDIDDTIYSVQGYGAINYENIMWIDGPITTAEYPFLEEGTQNGNGDSKIDFQKWEKQRTLIVPKAPEFISDAITAMRLHDTIEFTEAIRKNQIYNSSPVAIEKSETDLEYIFNDCAANLNVKMTLARKVVDTSCCNNIDPYADCITCTVSVSDINVLDTDDGTALLIGYPDYDDGIYTYNGLTWVLDPNQNKYVCTEGETRMWKKFSGGVGWIEIPLITEVVQDGTEFTITGYGIPNTYIKVTVTWTDSTESDPDQEFTLPGTYTVSQLEAGIVIDQSELPFDQPVCGSQIFKIQNYTLNCDYSFSNLVEINYYNIIICPEPCGYDEDACIFFNILEEELNEDAKEWYNNIFLNLKSTFQWDLIDRLWIFGTNDAGITITQEAAKTSLKFPGSAQIDNISCVWDSTNGFTGNGVDRYLDLKYMMGTQAIVATQNDNSVFAKVTTMPTLTGSSVSKAIIGNIGASTNYYIQMQDIGGPATMEFGLNSGSTSTETSGLSDTYLLSRSNATQVKLYRGTTLLGTYTQASAAFENRKSFIFALNNNNVSTVNYSNGTVRYAGFGKGNISETALNLILG